MLQFATSRSALATGRFPDNAQSERGTSGIANRNHRASMRASLGYPISLLLLEIKDP